MGLAVGSGGVGEGCLGLFGVDVDAGGFVDSIIPHIKFRFTYLCCTVDYFSSTDIFFNSVSRFNIDYELFIYL